MFDAVKRLYFPRWDKVGRWKAEFADSARTRGNTGYCDSKACRVYLHEDVCWFSSDAYIFAFLVHEIAHDVATAHHIRGWAVRLESAAKLAAKRGEQGIADAIRHQIYEYSRYALFHEVTGMTRSPLNRETN